MDAFLDNIIRGLVTYSTGIYALLGIGLLIFLRKLIVSWREWQTAVFGLEQKIAQRELTSAITGLVLLVFLAFGEFVLVTVVAPRLQTEVALSDPANALELSPQESLIDDQDSDGNSSDFIISNASGSVEQDGLVSECIEDILEITYPADGDVVSGTVEIIGSVNVDNFGSYKYEFSSAGTINWITISADNQLKLDERLGSWFTSSLEPGRYLLQLVPLNNVGEELTPCIVSVQVVSEE